MQMLWLWPWPWPWHVCAHIYIYIYIYMYIYIHTDIFMYACLHTWLHYIHTHAYTRTRRPQARVSSNCLLLGAADCQTRQLIGRKMCHDTSSLAGWGRKMPLKSRHFLVCDRRCLLGWSRLWRTTFKYQIFGMFVWWPLYRGGNYRLRADHVISCTVHLKVIACTAISFNRDGTAGSPDSIWEIHKLDRNGVNDATQSVKRVEII